MAVARDAASSRTVRSWRDPRLCHPAGWRRCGKVLEDVNLRARLANARTGRGRAHRRISSRTACRQEGPRRSGLIRPGLAER